MTQKVVSVKLQAQVAGFVGGMQKAKASVDDLTKAAAPSKAAAFEGFANKAAVAGLGIATAVGAAVKRFADFDATMSAVQANSGATGKTLDDLRNAAIKMGADSVFSATEAAEGINEMSKAGVGAKDILGGGLKGALDLAAAGQIGVAEAAETAATAMTQFKLSGDKVPHIADLLANAANKAQGGVGDMAAALKQAGLVASATGLTIEETTAGLTAFAKAGLIGSDAGTSFKTMLQRLSAPSGEAAEKMAELGISAYDSQGNFVGLANVAGQLTEAFKDKTVEERNSAMATIFGADAVRAANVLYSEGADGINRWTKEVTEQGAAAKLAAGLTDNLKGDVERLGGALDSVFIDTGSGANGALRGLTQGVTGLVETLGKVPGPVLLAGGAISSLALLAPKGLLAWRNYTTQLDTLGLSMDKISTKAPRTARGLDAAGKAAKGLAAALTAAAVLDVLFLDEAALPVQQLTKDLLDAKDASVAFNDAIVGLNTGTEGLGDTLRTAFDPTWFESAQGTLGTFIEVGTLGVASLGEPLGVAKERLTELDTALSGLVSGGSGAEAARIFDDIARAASEQGITVDQLKAKLPQYAEALAGVDNAARLTATSQGTMTTATDQLDAAADEAKQALSDLRVAIEGLGSPLAAQRAAESAFQAAIDAASASVKENGKALSFNSEKGRANQKALDDLRETTLSNVVATYEATGSTDKATAAMQRGRAAFVNAAIAAGYSADQANRLADNLGLVPKDVTVLVQQSGAESAEAAVDKAARDRQATIYVRTVERSTDKSSTYQGVGGKASGGPIWGPGTATSDSIPAYLSNGEYVIKAAAVAKYGVAMFDKLNAMRFAEGGYAHRFYAPRLAGGGPVQASAPAPMAPNVSVSVTAEPGLAREYAGYVARKVVLAQRDALAVHGLGGL